MRKRLMVAALVLIVGMVAWQPSSASPYDTLRAQCVDGRATGMVHLGDGQFAVAYIEMQLLEDEIQIEEIQVPFVDGQSDYAFAFTSELMPGSEYRVTSLGNTPAQILFTCASLATPVATPAGTPVGTPIAIR